MISSNKEYCAESRRSSLARSASWRRGLKSRFPDDSRLIRAAENLDQLASEASSLSDASWEELKNFYRWDSWEWSDAISQAARLVGYLCVPKTLSGFIE
jgi:hypothetical protein